MLFAEMHLEVSGLSFFVYGIWPALGLIVPTDSQITISNKLLSFVTSQKCQGLWKARGIRVTVGGRTVETVSTPCRTSYYNWIYNTLGTHEPEGPKDSCFQVCGLKDRTTRGVWAILSLWGKQAFATELLRNQGLVLKRFDVSAELDGWEAAEVPKDQTPRVGERIPILGPKTHK